MITVRSANADDVPRLLEIFSESLSPVWTACSIQSELEKKDSFFIVAVCNDAAGQSTKNLSPCVLGFAVFRQVGDDGELLQIATCPNARRRGIADRLLGATLEYATKKIFNAVHLEVRALNVAAIKLYEKHGFKKIRVRPGYYDNPAEDAIVYCLDLHSYVKK